MSSTRGGAVGTVLDAPNGVPIAQAWVSAPAASVQADEAGRFRLVGLPGGRFVLTAWAEGFVQRTSEIELAQGRERTGAAIHLDRGARVHGVVTADGQPVSGATVQAARYGFAAGLSAVAPVATTDSEGRFEGLVQPGRMALVARGGFWAEGRTEEFEVGPGDEREINLTLGAGGVIFGVIRDAQGSGAAGCRLQAFDSVHGRTTAETGSLGDGSYLLVGLSPAVYAVVAACGAGRAEAAGVSLAQGDRVQVDLELGVGVVAGQVVDSEGRPIGGAAIAIRATGAGPETPRLSPG